MEDFQIKKELLRIGLTEQECEGLSNEESFQYLRFYTKKYWQAISITFLGFPDDERINLINEVNASDLKVYKTLSQSLNFICLSDVPTQKQVEKTEKYSATVLSKNNFLKLFRLSYNLIGNELLYDSKVLADYRIAKPLSNFNEDIPVESFSLKSEQSYSANLYKMTCSCEEFHKQSKGDYPIGDLRRMCKHLILLYKNSFGVYNVSPLAKCVLDDGYGFHRNYSQIRIADIPHNIIVNFDQELGWWDLYVPNKLGKYIKYGYNPVEKRFYYNQKPIGIIPQLRVGLDLLEKEFSNRQRIGFNKPSNGCLLIILSIIVLGVLLYIF